MAISQAALKEKRVSLIDHNETTQTYLFRGNEPVDSNDTFQYDELKSVVTAKLKE